MPSLFLFFLTVIAFNLLMFIPAYAFQTDKLTDISYSLSFIFLALYALMFSDRTFTQKLLAGMVCLWAFRLGGFLFYRVNKTGKDSRFDDMRRDFLRFMRFWVLQGETVFVGLIAGCLYWQSRITMFDFYSLLGLIIFGTGFAIETLADLQKWRFTNIPNNKRKWVNSGLWAYSRHPNYFGEILVWLGIWVYTLSALTTSGKVVAALSPLYIFILLRYVSGVPILEKSAERKWGKDKAYKAYKNQTPLLIPFLVGKDPELNQS